MIKDKNKLSKTNKLIGKINKRWIIKRILIDVIPLGLTILYLFHILEETFGPLNTLDFSEWMAGIFVMSIFYIIIRFLLSVIEHLID